MAGLVGDLPGSEVNGGEASLASRGLRYHASESDTVDTILEIGRADVNRRTIISAPFVLATLAGYLSGGGSDRALPYRHAITVARAEQLTGSFCIGGKHLHDSPDKVRSGALDVDAARSPLLGLTENLFGELLEVPFAVPGVPKVEISGSELTPERLVQLGRRNSVYRDPASRFDCHTCVFVGKVFPRKLIDSGWVNH